MNEETKTTLSLSEQSYRLLRTTILTNELRPESFWSDKELCAKYDLSRTPVREALLRLQAEQLVQIVPRKGTRILPLAIDDVRDIQQLAKALELEAALSIARMDERDLLLRPLSACVSDMQAAIDKNDRDAWVLADSRFHHHTIDLCSNRRLAEIYHAQRELTDRARYFALYIRPMPIQSTVEHREMYELMLAGETDALIGLYHRHWTRTTEELLSIIGHQTRQSPFPKLVESDVS